MKILYVLHSGDLHSGSTRAFLSLLHHIKGDIEPVIVLPQKGALYDCLISRQYRVYQFPFRPACYPRLQTFQDVVLFVPRLCARKICNRYAALRMVQIIRQEHVQMVHSNSGVISCGFVAARKARIPHIWHLREYAEHLGFAFYPNNCYHLMQLQQSYTICITKGIQTFYNLDNNPMSSVLYDGVIAESMPMDAKQGKYLLYVGRVEKEKGVEVLLRAYASVHKSGLSIPLWIVGDYTPSYKEMLDELIKDCRNDVHFVGQSSNVYAYYKDAVAVIVPSLSEGFGFVMPEAQSMGTLVIVHDIEGLHEQRVVGEQKMGSPVAIRYNTEEELEGILSGISIPLHSTLLKIAQTGQKAASTLYSIETYCQNIFQLYTTIIQND